MPRFYTRKLRGVLAERIVDQLESSSLLEQLDVSEELALIRDGATAAVEAYAATVEADASVEARAAAGNLMTGKLQDVVATATALARIEQIKHEVAGSMLASMGAVVSEVLHACYEVFGDDYRVKDLADRLQRKLSAPVHPGLDGTTLTPDQDAIDMDKSVPHGE